MDKDVAIQQLKDFCLRHDLHRDKTIELYAEYKSGATEVTLETYTGYETYKFAPFWGYINTTDIRNIFKKTQVVEQDDVSNEPVNSTELSKVRKDMVTYKAKLNAERNLFNKQLRELSSLEELNREVIDCLKQLRPVVVPKSNKKMTSNNDVLICSIGDWHLGEISGEFKDTGFDMEIASKRIEKYAQKVKQEILDKNINKVVILCGGDICNNVTLLSKRLLQTSNRAVTTIMAVVLLQHLINDIYNVCPNIVFTGVGNNESRYDEDYFEDEYLITNCADYVVYNMLELLFENIPTVKFLSGRNCEKVVQVNGQNILLTHGVACGKGDVEKNVQQMISRYAVKGVDIRYVLLSHIHCTRNSNYFSRHGSLCSGNAYSNTTLNLQTRASQNILIVSKNGDIDTFGVDLENIDGFDGYDISNEVKKFNLRPRDKRISLDEIQIA